MHRPDVVEWADAYFLGQGGLFLKKKTFGCPSYYLGKKMAAFVHDDALVIKLPKEREEELIASGDEVYGAFAPMGNPMTGWLTITLPEASDYDGKIFLIEEGINFVASGGKR